MEITKLEIAKTRKRKNYSNSDKHSSTPYNYEFKSNNYTGKRSLDIVLSIIGLSFYALIFPIIYLGIKISDGGSYHFKQERIGFNGVSFQIFKLRTMSTFYSNNRIRRPALTKRNDERVYPFGRILRKTNLDELPQLLNVLKGEMSLVGPRPYMMNESQYWLEKFEDYPYRYSVKPGITGLAQVKGYRGGTFDEVHMRKRLDFDLIYTEKQSLFLDLKIITSTVFQMLKFKTKAH